MTHLSNNPKFSIHLGTFIMLSQCVYIVMYCYTIPLKRGKLIEVLWANLTQRRRGKNTAYSYPTKLCSNKWDFPSRMVSSCSVSQSGHVRDGMPEWQISEEIKIKNDVFPYNWALFQNKCMSDLYQWCSILLLLIIFDNINFWSIRNVQTKI